MKMPVASSFRPVSGQMTQHDIFQKLFPLAYPPCFPCRVGEMVILVRFAMQRKCNKVSKICFSQHIIFFTYPSHPGMLPGLFSLCWRLDAWAQRYGRAGHGHHGRGALLQLADLEVFRRLKHYHGLATDHSRIEAPTNLQSYLTFANMLTKKSLGKVGTNKIWITLLLQTEC